MSSTSFSHFRANFLRFVSSKRSSDDDTFLFAKDSRNYAVNVSSVSTDNKTEIGRTHHLQLILPELFLSRLVEEGEVSNMVNEDIPKDRKFRVDRGDFSEFRLKRSTEATEGGWGV
jgi:hypothetical protein